MELNPQIESEIKQMVAHYSKVMGFDKTPDVYFDRETPEKVRGYPYKKGHSTNSIFGEAYRDINGFFLNIPKFVEMRGLHGISEIKNRRGRVHTIYYREKIGHLEETLIHELVHLKYRHLKHGKGFERIVKHYYNTNRYSPITINVPITTPVFTVTPNVTIGRSVLLHRRRATKQALRKKGFSEIQIEAKLREKFPTL